MQIIVTTTAKQKLKQIYDYYEAASSKRIAESIINDIVGATEILIDQPFARQIEEFLVELGLKHRRIVEGNYKIIYRIHDDTIYITDIFDTRQNPKKMKR
jgi:plasmid stabilization system protein ParE